MLSPRRDLWVCMIANQLLSLVLACVALTRRQSLFFESMLRKSCSTFSIRTYSNSLNPSDSFSIR
jgi:hypothetical protein